jgi:hypothetical protein
LIDDIVGTAISDHVADARTTKAGGCLEINLEGLRAKPANSLNMPKSSPMVRFKYEPGSN